MLNIKKFNTGLYDVNTYIIWDTNTLDAAVIDWGGDFELVNNFLNENKLNLNFVLNTHGHFDHIMADDEVQKKLGTPIFAHDKDKELIAYLPVQLEIFGITEGIEAPEIDNQIEDGDILKLGNYNIKVLYTPGHSQGGVCYLIDDNLFSGDTLFLECIGRTDFPYGNHEQLINSIKTKLLPLDDKIKVFPGHGEETTIGHERKYNSFIQ